MEIKNPQIKFDGRDILKRRASSPSGCACHFVSIDKKWGVKLYISETARNEAYEAQLYCLERDMAPKIGDKIKLGRYFGYITEAAKPIKRWNYSLTDKVFKEYERIGCKFWDVAPCNCGIIGKGKIVAVDFGSESMFYNKPIKPITKV